MSRVISEKEGAGASGARAILRAAEPLFAERGYDGVSMTAVAERAGVSKANIFHHFKFKEALYLAVLRAACEETASLIQTLGCASQPLENSLTRFSEEHLALKLERTRASRPILREVLEHSNHRGRRLAQELFGESFTRLVSLVRDAQQRGEVRAGVDPAMAAVLLIGGDVFFFLARHVLRHFREMDFADDHPARYSAMMADILLHGILDGSRDERGGKP